MHERRKTMGRSKAWRDGEITRGNKGGESKKRLKLEDRKTQGSLKGNEGTVPYMEEKKEG